MDIPKKIRLLSYCGKVFPTWAMRQQALVIERAFDADLARVSNDWDARHAILAQRDFEASEYWGALAEHRSGKLLTKADNLGIPIGGLLWETDQYANRYLTSAVQTKLYHAIRNEVRKNWEFRLKVIGATTGLIGTLIGLAAIVRR